MVWRQTKKLEPLGVKSSTPGACPRPAGGGKGASSVQLTGDVSLKNCNPIIIEHRGDLQARLSTHPDGWVKQKRTT